jgi:hypothetical protein
MKTYGGVDVHIHVFLISALICPGRFNPGERGLAPNGWEAG